MAVSLLVAGGLVFKYRETQQRLYQLDAATALVGAPPEPSRLTVDTSYLSKSGRSSTRAAMLPREGQVVTRSASMSLRIFSGSKRPSVHTVFMPTARLVITPVNRPER